MTSIEIQFCRQILQHFLRSSLRGYTQIFSLRYMLWNSMWVNNNVDEFWQPSRASERNEESKRTQNKIITWPKYIFMYLFQLLLIAMRRARKKLFKDWQEFLVKCYMSNSFLSSEKKKISKNNSQNSICEKFVPNINCKIYLRANKWNMQFELISRELNAKTSRHIA